MKFVFLRPEICRRLPSDSTSRWTPCPPENCKRWLQVHLGCVRLSPSCPFRLLHTFLSLRPARHYPRLWIRRSSSERRRDFNPSDPCAAQRTLLDAPNPVLPSLPASFPSRSRYHRHPSFAPTRVGRPSRTGQGCSPASPTGFLSWSRTGLPGSLGDLCVHALLFDPGGSAAPARSLSAPLLPSVRFKTSAPTRKLSRLNPTACTLAVYASQCGSPLHHARLASGGWPTLTG